jgi:hypothetical protein
MTLMALGRSWSGDLLFSPREDAEVADDLHASLTRNVGEVRALAKATANAIAFQGGEVERQPFDVTDPRSAGWAFLLHADDSQNSELRDALRPLAEHRGMDATKPLLYRGEAADRWLEWLHAEYFKREEQGLPVPRYVLIVGGPDQIPFAFQAFLQTVASVGRVDFNADVQKLNAYASKVIRIETAPAPVVDRHVIMFGPDGGTSDPTYYSREYMVKPLAEHVREKFAFSVAEIVEDDATKTKLAAALADSRPALVYTASHGLGGTTEPLEKQRQFNGAICCQHNGPLTPDAMFSADDVPTDRPFLEGSVFFQFACYGYGTPAQSDFAHWLRGAPKSNAERDFVSALPNKLLAHPRGPIAYVGHLDIALLLGFTDAKRPMLTKRWHSRIAPFRSAIERLLAVNPAGFALEKMNQKYAATNAILTHQHDEEKAGERKWSEEAGDQLIDTWLSRADAQNFMVLGDPAARLRIPKTEVPNEPA